MKVRMFHKYSLKGVFTGSTRIALKIIMFYTLNSKEKKNEQQQQ